MDLANIYSEDGSLFLLFFPVSSKRLDGSPGDAKQIPLAVAIQLISQGDSSHKDVAAL